MMDWEDLSETDLDEIMRNGEPVRVVFGPRRGWTLACPHAHMTVQGFASCSCYCGERMVEQPVTS